ncbi:MAG: choice-of-anchor V domain-containing protein [Bacteroidota bacterium]
MKINRTKITGLFIAASSLIVGISMISSNNGIAGRVGSPGETTCNTSGCHTGNALNAPGGSITISAPTLVNWQYFPGAVYPISVTISRAGCPIYGVGFEALLSSGANAGTLTAGTGTTIKIANILGNSRTNVVHTLNGGASTTGSKTFTFNWTAPAAGTGTVTFYAAGNATNGSGSTSGDFIYTTSQTVTESATGVEEGLVASSIAIHPNPVTDNINLSFQLLSSEEVAVQILSLEGKLVETAIQEKLQSGKHNLVIPAPTQKGIYLLELDHSSGSITRKIVVL